MMPNDKEFIMGVDVSSLYQVERCGQKFFMDEKESDPFDVLRAFHINWIRVRLWVDPRDSEGKPLGGGNNDINVALALARRAKDAGMKWLLDLHFSDWWADPGKQNKPKAWEKISGGDLAQTVHDYTAYVLDVLKGNGLTPDMVQPGNEIENGFLWPDGQLSPKIDNWKSFATIMGSAIDAIRSTNDNIKVMVHISNGGTNELYRWFYDNFIEQLGAESFDYIGASYYPFFHGPIQSLESNLNDVAVRYGKPIVVAETAYPWKGVHENDLQAPAQSAQPYEASKEGQRRFLGDLIDIISRVPNGLGMGLFYWEGLWVSRGVCAGWKSGEPSNWSHLALFDEEGQPLPALRLLKEIKEQRASAGSKPRSARSAVSQPSAAAAMKKGDREDSDHEKHNNH
ncbi:glycoside hydrolase family 53 protein [Tardisphaera miroshnichenkoae]